MKPNLSIYTNGYEGTWPAIEYGAWMAELMHTRLTLTGVVEPNDSDHPVEELFSRGVTLFQEKNLDYSLELETGLAEELIINQDDLRKTVESGSDPQIILVLGPFGRPQVRRLIVGNSFRKIMEGITAPILFVPRASLPLRKVLICMGGLGFPFTSGHLGLQVAQMTRAAVTFLTVVPPVDLDYPEARKIRDNWKNLGASDTLPGRSLRQGLETAREAGLEAHIKVRHGNIVEQILEEVREGGYELICMGSQFSAHSLRQLYTPNVTADVAEACLTPILTVRDLKPEK